MSDLLVELNTKPWFRQAIKSLGLPLPSPQKLRRPKTARARPISTACSATGRANACAIPRAKAPIRAT